MRADKTDVDNSIWVIDLYDEAVLVATYVEHYAAALQDAGISVLSFDIYNMAGVSCGWLFLVSA